MKMEWRGIVEDMRNAAKFNRTPLNNLPDGFRVSGTIFGEAVVTRESVAKRLEIWADFIEYECNKLEHLLIAEQEENIDLRRALKPVMDLDCSAMRPIESWTACGYNIEGEGELHIANFEVKDDAKWAVSCDNAVRKAQSIMKRGGKC